MNKTLAYLLAVCYAGTGAVHGCSLHWWIKEEQHPTPRQVCLIQDQKGG
jgi:hypothetical protein